MSDTNVLASFAPFSSLPEQDLALLSDNLAELTLQDGQLLVQSSALVDGVYFLVNGKLKVKHNSDAKSASELEDVEELGSGSSLGWSALFDPFVFDGSITAAGQCKIVKLASSHFQSVLQSSPSISRAIFSFIGGELRSGATHVAERDLASSLNGLLLSNNGTKIKFFDAKPYMNEAFLKENEAKGYNFGFDFVESKLSKATIALAKGAKILCLFVNDSVTAEMAPKLKQMGVQMIALRCNGSDNIDIKACDAAGITVARVPNYSPYSVAEHAVALMMSLNRKIHIAHHKVKVGDFSLNGLVGFDMHGKTVGLIGTGKIGACLIDILLGFGTRVLCYDLYPSPALQSKPGVTYVSLADVFTHSDIISLHVPLTPQTHHLINDDTLSQCKDKVMIINTSRGGLIDTAALVRGLKSGKIGSAGLDVYEQERDYFYENLQMKGVSDDVLARLMTFPNVLVTSHQAFLTNEALEGIAGTALFNISEFVAGKRGTELKNSANSV
ncbi:hypothetical protein HK104_008924 [Borealophlyctis nickersoniae]|nr:hypothetical protein HK104_008924 [Borealophlyctis nickersoniae]